MRIIGGRHRGRNIVAPDGSDIRPTSDRVRESVFNILQHRKWGNGGVSVLTDTHVLDAFCGTGACGLEALSRGAAHVTFIDNSNTALDICRRNIASLGELDRTDVLRNDCLKLVRSARPYNLVFIDPPYRQNLIAPAIRNLATMGWISPQALCVAESSSDEEISPNTEFHEVENRRYGSTRVRIFKYLAGAEC